MSTESSTATAIESSETPKYTSREEYLLAAVEQLRPWFGKQNYDLPPLKVSCGFPSKSPLKNLGECWSPTATADGTTHIFVTPTHRNASDSIGTLAHELLHAALPDDAKHGPIFKEGMKKVGLEGKPKSAGPGPELQLYIDGIVEMLGEYPNSPLTPRPKPKKEQAQAKKSFKLFCPKKRAGDKSCLLVDKTVGGDYSVTVSRKMLKLAFPVCVCGAEMEMESEDFELYKLGESND